MAHRIAPQAEADLADIWDHIAKESGSAVTSDRLVDSLTDRFFLLANHPYIGRRRDDDLRAGLRSFSVREYIVLYRIESDDVLILSVVHGRRDIEALFGH